MKKAILILIAGLLLGGCATAPSSSVQDTLIKGGNIKIGMKYNDLLQALGGEGAIYPQYPFVKEENFKHMIPNMYDFYRDTKYYSFEHINPSVKWGFWGGADLDGYRLTKIWDDYVPMIDHYINLSKNEKDRNNLVKLKSRALEHYRNQENTSTASNTTTTPDITFTILSIV